MKEQFKTAKGKHVAPLPIESRLSTNSLIEQVCVLGAGRPAPMAIVVLNDQGLNKDQIKANLEQTLEAVNEQLESQPAWIVSPFQIQPGTLRTIF